jgi:hypothetical protein
LVGAQVFIDDRHTSTMASKQLSRQGTPASRVAKRAVAQAAAKEVANKKTVKLDLSRFAHFAAVSTAAAFDLPAVVKGAAAVKLGQKAGLLTAAGNLAKRFR